MEHNPLLHFDWKIVGSTAEQTKIGQPEEFDTLLMFRKFSEYLHPHEEVYYALKTSTYEADDSREFPDVSDDGMLSEKKLHRILFSMLTTILSKEDFWDSLDFSFVNFRVIRPGFALTIQSRTTDLIIKFDLIPTFMLNDSVDELFVFVGDDVLLKSAVLKEIELLRSLPTNPRNGYILAKSLCSPTFMGYLLEQPVLSEVLDKALPSFTLKNALFHAVEHERRKGTDIQELPPHEWLKRIFLFLEDKNLKGYFTHNLVFDDRYTPVKQNYFNYYVKQKLRREKFRDFKTIVDYRYLFLDVINRILWRKVPE